MTLEEKIHPYLIAIDQAVENRNWLLAMMGALTLPDICSTIAEAPRKDEKGEETTKDEIDNLKTGYGGKKFARWFDEYCTQYKVIFYTKKNEPKIYTKEDYLKWMKSKERLEHNELEETKYVYFNGLLAYAFRCSFLHVGSGKIDEQKIHENNIEATLGANEIILDLSVEQRVIQQIDGIVHLNPKHFCDDIIDAVHYWLQDNKNYSKALENSEKLITIKAE